MQPTPFVPDRYEPNPQERTTFCPISHGDPMMTPAFRIPTFQAQWRESKTKKEKVKVLREWAKATGFLGDAPDIFQDFIEMEQKEAA